MENGKVCNGCNEFKKNDNLTKYKKRNGEYSYLSMCKTCETKRKSKYDRTDYEKQRNQNQERKKYAKEFTKCNKTCEQCQNTFIGHKYQEQKFCQGCKVLNKHSIKLITKTNKELNCSIKEQQKKQKLMEIELIKKQKRIIKVCEQCGESFAGINTNAKYCCDGCRKRAANRKKELSKDTKMKKAKLNGQFDSDITLEKLVKQYGLKCYICHENCNWNDHTITSSGHFIVGKTYPTIEHVIAIYNGGTHSWNNVRVSCHDCNTHKGTKPLGEVI